jgi:hypothetical protein
MMKSATKRKSIAFTLLFTRISQTSPSSFRGWTSHSKGICMKKYLFVGLTSLSLILGSNTSATAEGQGGQKVSINTWKAENKAKAETYKQALKTYMDIKKANEIARKEIGTKFKADSDALRAKTKAAVEAATSVEAKKAASAAGKTAMEKLIADRKAALSALPNPGTKPIKPAQTARPANPSPKASPTK